MKMHEKPLLLLNSVAKGDFAIVGGSLHIPNSVAIRLNDIIDVKIVAPRAEVAKVVTIGTSAPTITVDTIYVIRVTFQGKRDQGWESTKKEYRVVSSSTIADQATERARIYALFATQINADIEFPITAVANTDASLVITDRSGYFTKYRGGETHIKLLPDGEGRGFVDATHNVVTTPAVYSAGIGSDLLLKAPQTDPMIGNAYVGSLANTALENIVGGQRYHSFIITSVVGTNGNEMIADAMAMKKYVQMLLIDDGTGSSTTNAAGFAEALAVLEAAKYHRFKADKGAVVATGAENALTFGPNGGTALATDAATNSVVIGDSKLFSTNIGAATSAAIAEIANVAAGGYDLDGDETATEGKELHTGVGAIDPGYVVGKGSFSVRSVFNVADHTDVSFQIGFRIKAAVAAALTTYTDYAAIGNLIAGGESISVFGNLNDGTDYTLDTTVDGVDSIDMALEVVVHPNGTATGYINDRPYQILSAASVPLVFDAGDELVPFVRAVNIGSGSPTTIMKKLYIVGADENRAMNSIIAA